MCFLLLMLSVGVVGTDGFAVSSCFWNGLLVFGRKKALVRFFSFSTVSRFLYKI